MDRIFSLHRFLTSQRQKYPWLIGAAMWAGWLLSLVLGRGNLDLSGHLIGTDFVAFYTAGKIILSGNGAYLYDLELARSIQLQIYGQPTFNFNPYLNPPHYAFLMAPFALLPYPWAPILWMVAGLALLWSSMRWLGAESPLKTTLLSMTWIVVFYATSFGQNTFLSLAILSLTYFLWKKQKIFFAGLVLSLLFFKPQFLLGVGFLWLLEWRKNWKALISLGSGILVQAGFSFWLLPLASLDYVNYVRHINANLMLVDGFPMWNAFSLQAFWLALLPGRVGLATFLYWLCAIPSLIAFLLFWKKYRYRDWLCYAASISFMIWEIPYIMVYDWAILLIPAILMWKHLPHLRPQLSILYAIIWISSFLSNSLTYLQLRYFHSALQLSIPIMLVVYILANKLIRKNTPIEQIG